MPHAYPSKVIIKWKYDGKEGSKEFEGKDSFVWWDEDWKGWSTFWWDEGNGACDCNRLPMLVGIDDPDRKCENKVEIEDIDIKD